MKDTIFVPAFGNRPRNLIGREDILRLFEASLQSLPAVSAHCCSWESSAV